MNFITYDEYKKRIAELKSNYWNEGAEYRWKYISRVIELAKEIKPRSVIEAGTSGIMLSKPDLTNIEQYETTTDFCGDLNIVPFGISPEDSTYDLFIALQTWEHLDNQAEAFREVMRISKAAILSFPYKWKHGDNRHRGIDENKIAEWTCGIKPKKTELIKNRIIYVWEF